MNRETVVPEGRDFLELVWNQEEKCQTETDTLLPNLGKKAPAAMIHVGTVMSLLDRMASCWWVCRGGDHRIDISVDDPSTMPAQPSDSCVLASTTSPWRSPVVLGRLRTSCSSSPSTAQLGRVARCNRPPGPPRFFPV